MWCLTPSTGINVVNEIKPLRKLLLRYQSFNDGIKSKKIGTSQQRFVLKGLGTEGQRDKVLKGINLFFVATFQLTHSTSSPTTSLRPYVPMSLRRRRSIPYSSGLSFRYLSWYSVTGKTKGLNPLFIRSQFQILTTEPWVELLTVRSQSLIHQVSVSDKVNQSTFLYQSHGSQSLIHQVSVSDRISGHNSANNNRCVSIPYSSGLSFR